MLRSINSTPRIELLIFLFALLISPSSNYGQQNHTILCGHSNEKQDEGLERQMVNGFVSGWTEPYVIDVATDEPYHWVYVTDYTDVAEISISHPIFDSHTLNGNTITELVLYDDGLGNDEVAGDNVFASADIVYTNPNNYQHVAGLFTRFSTVNYLYNDSSTSSHTVDLGYGFRVVNSDNIDINPNVTSLSPTVQYSSHVMNIAVDLTNTYAFQTLSNYTNQYYDYFPDTKDALMFATSFATPGGPAASYTRVQVQETGVMYNQTPFDFSDSYGSAGQLKGLMRHFYTYGGVPSLVNHEFMHQFGTVLHPDLELTIGGSHWNLVEYPSSGFGSGWQKNEIIEVDPDCYDAENTNYTSAFNNLEMYLMGLSPLDDVDWPLTALVDWTFNGWGDPCPFSSTAGTIEVTQADFENLMGPRVPSVADAQKDFDFGMIVLTKELMTPKEMAYYQWQMIQNELPANHPNRVTVGYSALNFEEATNGLGTLNTKLPCPLDYVDDLVITDDPIPLGSYGANNSIVSTTIGETNGDINFSAGVQICLDPGFEIPLTTNFSGVLNDCEN